MSKVQWEYDLVERPFCEQLKAMGWQWIEGWESGLMTDFLAPAASACKYSTWPKQNSKL